MTAWGFIVGINHYPDASKLNALHGAVADAAAFAEWALDPFGGGVLPEHLFLWTCPEPPITDGGTLANFMAAPTSWPIVKPDFSRAPTANEISMAVDLVASDALEAGATRLYIFLAGHGYQTRTSSFEEDPQTCFVAGDYHPRWKAMGLVPCDDMIRMLKVKGPPEIIVFIDACRSDASIRVARRTGIWDLSTDPGHNLCMAIGRAAQPTEVAYEIPHGAPLRGAFSQLLVEGLKSHRVGDMLTMEALKSYVSSALPDLVKPYSQYPDFQERPGHPALVLVTGQSTTGGIPLTVDFAPARVGANLVIVGGPENMRQTIVGTAEPLVLRLPPGAYVIEEMGGITLNSIAHVDPGGTHVTV